MKKALLGSGSLVALLFTLAFAAPAEGQGSEAGCLAQAAGAFVACVDDHAWYLAVLCELRYNVDALMCTPATVVKGFM